MSDYKYLYEYRPAGTGGATPEQAKVRADVFAFKEGACPDCIKRDMADALRLIVGAEPGAWSVCFVPAHTLESTVSRYYELASYLSERFPGIVYLNTLQLSADYDSVLEERRRIECNASRVKGKKVVVIDDILNTGAMFDGVCGLLLGSGASQVTGLFIARVVRA